MSMQAGAHRECSWETVMDISEASTSADGPHPVDIHIGQSIRAFRTRRGLSQSALGERIGVTFQQVQKYERGTNRVSGSRLYEIAGVLGVSIADFYEGLPDPSQVARTGENVPDLETVFNSVPDAASLRLIELYKRLPPRLRKAGYALIAAMADPAPASTDRAKGGDNA